MRFCIFIVLALVMQLPFYSSCSYPEQYKPLPVSAMPDVLGIEVIVPHKTIYEEETVQAMVVKILPNGAKKPADSMGCVWKSTGLCAEVDVTGLIRGIKKGTAEIQVSCGDFSAFSDVTIIGAVDYSGILINEVFYDADGSDDGKEFVEIYNGGPGAVDISSMSIIDGALSSSCFTFPEMTILESGQYAVVASLHDGFLAFFGYNPDFSGFSFILNNSGETVMLMSPVKEIIDIVYIEGGSGNYPAPESWGSRDLPASGSAESISRCVANDTDIFADWCSGMPTPGM